MKREKDRDWARRGLAEKQRALKSSFIHTVIIINAYTQHLQKPKERIHN